jgi:putative ATP-dependent endonuclease of OLD family
VKVLCAPLRSGSAATGSSSEVSLVSFHHYRYTANVAAHVGRSRMRGPMFVKKLIVENVKSFRSERQFNFTDGLNFLVGDNNGGKSTVFEAMLFLFDGPSTSKWTPDTFYSTGAGGPTRVTADLAGEVRQLVAMDKFAKLAPYVFKDADGADVLRVERNSEMRDVAQGGKTVKLDVKKFCFWNPVSEQFENATGIDALAKAMIDFEAIWADTSPTDFMDFGTTKTLGRLLDVAFKRFAETDRWKSLVAAHKSAFSSEEDSFVAHTRELATEMQNLVQDQYGHAEVRFGFEFPDASMFMKMGNVLVNDGAGETPISGKGSGMQRAMTLGVIQLYAKSEALSDETSPKPLILLLDEPETWLHPRAQLRLADALSVIAEKEQVFIITHSPYLIRKFDSSNHQLAVFTGQGNDREVRYSVNMGMLGTGEPTWGEINYRAFGICSDEFHNELYGYIQKHLDELHPQNAPTREVALDNFLSTQGFAKSKTWARSSTHSYPSTLPVYIRNTIHHPENTLNLAPSDSEFEESTRELVRVVEALRASPTN